MRDSRSLILLFVLLVTAFSSLVYEVVWGRQLSLIFGTSAFAITAVLTVFMAGLAFGALYGGRLIDSVRKKHQLLGFVEILIGISCLLTLHIIPLVSSPYFFLHSIFGSSNLLFNISLFVLAFMILIIPTFLIGIAFPSVTRLYFDRKRMLGRSVGTAYMVDTIGGALGALLTGFFLVAMFGFYRVSLMASVFNILCGIILLLVFWGSSETIDHHEEPKTRVRGRMILVLFFFSGFAALMFEVVWTRYISLIYGSSMHSFAIVLGSFLAGLGIGSVIASRCINRIRSKVLAFAFIELLIGLVGMCLVVVFPALEKVFMDVFFSSVSFSRFNFLLFIICFAVLLVPTMLMGSTLPVISAIYASERKVGTDVGMLFSVNSFGSIFGSFLAGFIIIPLVGPAYTSILAGLIYISIALLFIYFYTEGISTGLLKDVMTLTIVLLTLGFLVLVSFYDQDYLYKGVYYHGTRYDNSSVIFKTNIESTTQMLYSANSPYGTVTVFRSWDDSNVWLKNNGKTDASLGDMLTQGMLAHVPLALHDNPRQVLNIGMGGAFSAASVMSYPDVDRLDIVEIDPKVVDACRTVLAPYNNHVLADPRANTIVADGRNYLFSSGEMYDVIISEPPNIWVSGVSSLFTYEFYSIVADHLDGGGMFSQWFPAYDMMDFDYLIALNTMRSVFPYLYEFDLGGDVIVVASMDPIKIEDDINRFRLSQEYVNYDFEYMISQSEYVWEYLYDDEGNYVEYDPYDLNYEFILRFYSKGPEMIDKEIEDVGLVNSDDWPILEFATLRNKYQKFR